MSNKPTRKSLIIVLMEGGKSASEIDAELAKLEYSPLTSAEKSMLTLGVSKPEEAKPEPDAPVAAPVEAEPEKATAAAGEKKSQFDKVVGSKDGKPVTAAQAIATQICYGMVDVMRTHDPEAYKAYRAIKYPGDVESLATAETKEKAYKFAFDWLLKFKV